MPQCSLLLLLLHPPPSSPLSHGSQSCEKTLITVPKAAGNTMESAQSCSCHTHKQSDSWTTNTHPPAQGAYRDTHIHFHILPSYSSQSINFFISFACSKTLRTDAVRLSWCYGCCLAANFQEAVLISPHHILSAYRCGAWFLTNLVISSWKQSLLLSNINSHSLQW